MNEDLPPELCRWLVAAHHERAERLDDLVDAVMHSTPGVTADVLRRDLRSRAGELRLFMQQGSSGLGELFRSIVWGCAQ
jgi:hypothetical protein